MLAIKKQDPLAEVLERLEQHLELPYVSGDLQAWAETVIRLLRETDQRVRTAIETEHPSVFKTIIKNHSNLRQQVDKLREEDGQIMPALEAVLCQAEQFAGCIDETALAGTQFQVRRERLINDGLALVIRIRRQQVGIDTWLGEALLRDNGVGD